MGINCDVLVPALASLSERVPGIIRRCSSPELGGRFIYQVLSNVSLTEQRSGCGDPRTHGSRMTQNDSFVETTEGATGSWRTCI